MLIQLIYIILQVFARSKRWKFKNITPTNIIIIWIPGHIGIIGNEKPDKQTKLAISSPDSQYINIPLYSDTRKPNKTRHHPTVAKYMEHPKQQIKQNQTNG